VFDHFGPNITAEHNCYQKAIKLRSCTNPREWDDFSL